MNKKIAGIFLFAGALQLNALFVVGEGATIMQCKTEAPEATETRPENVSIPYELFLLIMRRAAEKCDFNILDEQMPNLTKNDREYISGKAFQNCRTKYGFPKKSATWDKIDSQKKEACE